MLVVHENVAEYKATKPMDCPKCGCKRSFDVTEGTFVRKSKRGRPPSSKHTDMVFLKCKKCGHLLGISLEQD